MESETPAGQLREISLGLQPYPQEVVGALGCIQVRFTCLLADDTCISCSEHLPIHGIWQLPHKKTLGRTFFLASLLRPVKKYQSIEQSINQSINEATV